MTPATESEARQIGQTHDRWVAAIEQLLTARNWRVDSEPRLAGNLRPDIVAHDPRGTSYVFEVKDASSPVHLGAIAQAEAYRNSLAHSQGEDVRGVVVLTGAAPPQLHEVAERAGIALVEAETVEAASDALASIA
jgi:RecB family endonuclease NucS